MQVRAHRRPPASSEPDLERAVGLLEVVPRVMCRLRAEIRAQVGHRVTFPQYRVLGATAREPRTASELADRQGVSLSAMSRMVATLVRHGLLERLPVAGDRRQVKLQPTPAGRAEFTAVKRKALARLGARIALFPPADQRKLADGLAVLARLAA